MKASCQGLPPVNKAGMSFAHYAECVAQRLWRRLGDGCHIDLPAVKVEWQAGTTIRETVEKLVDRAWDQVHAQAV